MRDLFGNEGITLFVTSFYSVDSHQVQTVHLIYLIAHEDNGHTST